MRNVTFRHRLGYWFDNVMARGTPALIAGLALLSLALIFVISIIVVLVPGAIPSDDSGQPLGFFDIAWMGLMRTLDAGTMGGDKGQWPFLLSMLGITMGGIFVVSALIGVLTNGIDSKITQLRKGRSVVLESGHTIILGWSDQVFSILGELAIANASKKRPCVAVLAPKDKIEMEDEIKDKVADTGRLRVVCRTGSPIDMVDLNIVNPQGSRSIIVLAPEVIEPDAEVIKSVLAITRSPSRRAEPYHVVAQIRDEKNLEVARLIGGDETKFINVGEAVSRLIAQTCRQSGLSVVYTELLDFAGDEIYMQEQPELAGKEFGEALLAYATSSVIGLQRAGGLVVVNPPPDTIIERGDRVIVVAEDDSSINLAPILPGTVDEGAIVLGDLPPHVPERTLVLGWNWRAAAIINELDNYVSPGSEVKVVASGLAIAAEVAARCAVHENQTISAEEGDVTDRRTLDHLNPSMYDHVIVLSYSEQFDAQRADARTLITLLHLRDIRERSGSSFSIVSEMQDIRNKELAEVARADDLIVSDKLISLMTAQISENPYLRDVFNDILDAGGSEIYLKPASAYVKTGVPVNFYTVVESARRRGQAAIGYRLQADAESIEKSYGVVINPDKTKQVSFSPADKIIVFAED